MTTVQSNGPDTPNLPVLGEICTLNGYGCVVVHQLPSSDSRTIVIDTRDDQPTFESLSLDEFNKRRLR